MTSHDYVRTENFEKLDPMTSPTDDRATAAADALSAWHRARTAFVTSDLGNLALVLTHWGNPDEAPVDEATARAAYAAQVAGEPGTENVAERIIFTRLERENIDDGRTEHGYRIWDPASPANAAFQEILAYDFNPDWVIPARFEYVATDRALPFEHIRDAGRSRDLAVTGDIVFTVDGTEMRLAAFTAPENKLQLVFGDPTNGRISYGAGRFLYVANPAPEGAAPGESFDVTLDFNRAFVPPCGFSSQMNCPLPPASNRFSIPVTAGEQRVSWADGFSL